MEQQPIRNLVSELELAKITDRALHAQVRYHTEKIQALYLLIEDNNQRMELINAANMETTS